LKAHFKAEAYSTCTTGHVYLAEKNVQMAMTNHYFG